MSLVATTRMATGDPFRFFAYVYDDNRVIWTCDHEHRRRRNVSGDVFARRCAEKALRRLQSEAGMTHYWRVRTRLPERCGQPCRIIARGRMNTILVEFADGHRVTTSRHYVRRLR